MRYLAASWGAERLATIDQEEFYDFTATRPEVYPAAAAAGAELLR